MIDALLALRSRRVGPWLTVLTYHRIARLDESYAFERGVVDCTPEDFDQQMALLQRHCSVIGIEELRQYFDGGSLPPHPVMVTFDDGYRDNHETALPILVRRGIKAVFFIATDYIEQRRLYWWDRISYLFRRTGRQTVSLEYPTRLQLRPQHADAVERVLHLVKEQYGLQLDRLLGELTSALDVPWSRDIERQLADQLIMSWGQIQELRAAGMDVQSHTSTHRVLHTLSQDDLTQEFSGSRQLLEQRLGSEVCAISYPVGRPLAELGSVSLALEQAGYELGFTNGTGANPLWQRPHPLNIRRLPMEGGYSGPYFRSILALPQLASHGF